MNEASVVAKCTNNSPLFIFNTNPVVFRRQNLFTLILFACGFLAVQRFTISPINASICAFPLCLFVVQMLRGHHQTALTCLVLGLFLSIDNGGGSYAETTAPLRYLIYVSAIVLLIYFSKRRIQRQSLLLAALLLCGITYGSMENAFGTVPIDGATLQRDLIVLLILSTFLMVRSSVQLDLHLIYYGSLGYLVGEVVNGLFFYRDITDYLSYDSLKVFVIFPLFYALITRKNIISQLTLAIATLYVILMYGSRMITLSFIVLLLPALIASFIQNGHGRGLLGFLVALIALLNINFVGILTDPDLIQYKALSFIFQVVDTFEVSDIYQMLVLLDPVRFAEHRLFFERPILQVVFGSGLGSGIFDVNGVLGFVTFDQTAFSDNEISSSIFFNLHDFWIDFGLRFGLLPLVFLIYLILFREMLHRRPWHGVLFGMLLLNTTFATSGILLTALLVRFMPITLEK